MNKLKVLSGAAIIAAAGLSPAMASVVDRPYFKSQSVVIVFGASDFLENAGQAPVVSDFYLLDNVASGVAGNDIIGSDGTTINYFSNAYNPISDGTTQGWAFEVNNPTSGGTYTNNAPLQTLDAGDSYSAFGIDATTDIDLLNDAERSARFFVASNAVFDVFAESSNLVTSGDFSVLDLSNIRFRLTHDVSGGGGAMAWGADAQDPAIGGSGIVLGNDPTIWTLNDMSAGPTKVFDGGQRTASTLGSIMTQATSFHTRYNLIGSPITGSNYDFSMGTGTISADITFTIYAP